MSKAISKILIVIAISLSSIFGQSKKTSTVIHPDWSKNATIYEVNIRQYTQEGTFNAFAEHLPRLKEMGVKILWIMPIHPIGELNRKGSLGSYYAVKDYKAVNPEFGTLEDFKNLVDKVHEMGIYIIIDWVANHTAWDNVWTKTNPEFYNRNKEGKFFPPVEGWQDVIDLNYDNKELWSAMIDALKYWVRECNIDGYRCDVAAMVPTEFWIKARGELNKIKPVFLLAEASEPELHEHAFDMTYNWELKDIMNDIAAGKKNVKDLLKHFQHENKVYPENSYRMNFTTNHDENSWNGTVFERLGDGAAAFAVLTATVEGMPLVYSGQEAGLNKRLNFFDKDQIEWKEHPFAGLYKKLLNLNLENKALWNGNYGGKLHVIKSGTSKNTLSFVRQKDGNKVLTIINLSNDNVEVKVKSKVAEGDYTDLFTGESIHIGNKANFNLKPWGYMVLYK